MDPYAAYRQNIVPYGTGSNTPRMQWLQNAPQFQGTGPLAPGAVQRQTIGKQTPMMPQQPAGVPFRGQAGGGTQGVGRGAPAGGTQMNLAPRAGGNGSAAAGTVSQPNLPQQQQAPAYGITTGIQAGPVMGQAAINDISNRMMQFPMPQGLSQGQQTHLQGLMGPTNEANALDFQRQAALGNAQQQTQSQIARSGGGLGWGRIQAQNDLSGMRNQYTALNSIMQMFDPARALSQSLSGFGGGFEPYTGGTQGPAWGDGMDPEMLAALMGTFGLTQGGLR